MTEDKFHSVWVRQIGEMANPFTFELPMGSICIKYSLFAWNFLLFILGMVLIGTGFTVAAEYVSSGNGFNELINNKYISLPIFIGVVGILLALVTFFGCYGSIKESSVMTGAYVVLLILMMLSLLIGGIVGYAYRNAVDDYVNGMLEVSMGKFCLKSPGPWHWIQKNFECCGIKGAGDWIEQSDDFKYWSRGYFEMELNKSNETVMSKTPVPFSCCVKNSSSDDSSNPDIGCGILKDAEIFSDGCLDKVENQLKDNLVKVAGAAVGISLFSLITIILGWCLAKQYSKKQEHYRNM